jgi:hypothetical protein
MTLCLGVRGAALPTTIVTAFTAWAAKRMERVSTVKIEVPEAE